VSREALAKWDHQEYGGKKKSVYKTSVHGVQKHQLFSPQVKNAKSKRRGTEIGVEPFLQVLQKAHRVQRSEAVMCLALST